MAERYAIAAVANGRAPWVTRVSQWAATGLLPIDIIKCVSVDEVRARFRAGQRFAAVLADADSTRIDNDLIATISSNGSCLIYAGKLSPADLPQDALVLDADFTSAELSTCLVVNTKPSHSFVAVGDTLDLTVSPAQLRGRLIGVTGAGGSGSTTIAMALAQGIAQRPAQTGNVVLVDGGCVGEHAMYHDTRDVVPNLGDLLELSRQANPTSEQVRTGTYHIESRGYDALLGLANTQSLALLRPKLLDLSMAAITAAYATTVVDFAPALDGEKECGSIDVEEHNALNRYVATKASLILVTGQANAKGVFTVSKIIERLIEFGVDPSAIIPTIIGQRTRRFRPSEAATAISEITHAATRNVMELAFESQLEAIHRSVSPMPTRLVSHLVAQLDLAENAVSVEYTDTTEVFPDETRIASAG